MRRRSFILGLLGAALAAPALAAPAFVRAPAQPARPSPGEPTAQDARGRGWGRGGNPYPRGRARRTRRGWGRHRW